MSTKPGQLHVRTDTTTVRLELGDPNVHLGGQFVGVTNKILSIAGVNFNAKAREALQKAIDPAKRQVSVPVEYLKLNPTIDEASFDSEGGRLSAVLVFGVIVPTAQVNATISQLVMYLQKQKE